MTTTTSRRSRWISSQDQLSPLTSDLPICILNKSLFMLWRRCVQHVKLPLLGLWGTWCWFFFVLSSSSWFFSWFSTGLLKSFHFSSSIQHNNKHLKNLHF